MGCARGKKYHRLTIGIALGLSLHLFALARGQADRADETNGGLTSSTFLELVDSPARVAALTIVPSGDMQAIVEFGDRSITLNLWPESVRAVGFELVLQLPDGTYQSIDPGPLSTFRGVVNEWPGSDVRGSQVNGEVRARIETPDEQVYWLEPANIQGAFGNNYTLRKSESSRELGGSCVLLGEVEPEDFEADAGIVAGQGTDIVEAELAIDADYEFFMDLGDAYLAASQIEVVIHAANAAYERDVGIRHVLSRIVIRTGDNDPYSSDDPETLLRQFSDQWRNNHDDIPYDVAQLFTGRSLAGSTIGVAWRYGICNANSYSVVESGCCGSLSCKSDLTAHELGHNWSAGHCQCGGWTMNATLSCANQFHPVLSAPGILSYRNARTCLTLVHQLRRVVIEAPDEVEEQTAVQLRAIGVPSEGDPMDLTADTVWSWWPFEGGTIDAGGVFRAADLDFDMTVTIDATVHSEVGNGMGQRTLIVRHLPDPNLRIVGSFPPNGSIDARQPRDLYNVDAQGWRSVELEFSGAVGAMGLDEFQVTHLREDVAPPRIIQVVVQGPNRVQLVFHRSLSPGTWTTISHSSSGTFVRLGFFPGDVNADGTVTGDDIRALVRMLSGEIEATALWSVDINRSGQLDPGDLLRIIDLFNVAALYDFPIWEKP